MAMTSKKLDLKIQNQQQNMGISPNNLVSLRCQEIIHLVNDARQIHGQIKIMSARNHGLRVPSKLT